MHATVQLATALARVQTLHRTMPILKFDWPMRAHYSRRPLENIRFACLLKLCMYCNPNLSVFRGTIRGNSRAFRIRGNLP